MTRQRVSWGQAQRDPRGHCLGVSGWWACQDGGRLVGRKGEAPSDNGSGDRSETERLLSGTIASRRIRRLKPRSHFTSSRFRCTWTARP